MNRTDADNGAAPQGPESTSSSSSDFEKHISLERKLHEATALAAGIRNILEGIGTNLASAKARLTPVPISKSREDEAKETEVGDVAREKTKTRWDEAIAKERSRESAAQVDENSMPCDQPPSLPEDALQTRDKSPKL